jgi:hypothetical protein
MEYILYKTTNIINGRIYVGIHQQDDPYTFDGYLGSGKALFLAIKKYGNDSFVRETLLVFYCLEEAKVAEAVVVDKEFIERKDNYNMTIGGGYPPRTTKFSKPTNRPLFPDGYKSSKPASETRKQKMRKPKPEGFAQRVSAAKKGKFPIPYASCVMCKRMYPTTIISRDHRHDLTE